MTLEWSGGCAVFHPLFMNTSIFRLIAGFQLLVQFTFHYNYGNGTAIIISFSAITLTHPLSLKKIWPQHNTTCSHFTPLPTPTIVRFPLSFKHSRGAPHSDICLFYQVIQGMQSRWCFLKKKWNGVCWALQKWLWQLKFEFIHHF